MALFPEAFGLAPAPLKAPAKPPHTADLRDASMRETAREFEAMFIGEMLSHAGFDKALSQNAGFGGEAFSRMLVETYAQELSKKGGFGIAEQIFNQLKENQA